MIMEWKGHVYAKRIRSTRLCRHRTTPCIHRATEGHTVVAIIAVALDRNSAKIILSRRDGPTRCCPFVTMHHHGSSECTTEASVNMDPSTWCCHNGLRYNMIVLQCVLSGKIYLVTKHGINSVRFSTTVHYHTREFPCCYNGTEIHAHASFCIHCGNLNI